MEMLKRIFLFIAVTVLAASCLGNGNNYSASYAVNASFEYGEVFKSDSLFIDQQYGFGYGWRDLSFCHKLNDEKTEFRGGFILSRLKGNGDSDQNRFRVNSGAGYMNTQCYVVYYQNPEQSAMPSDDIIFTSSEVGTCSMLGCFVNNTKEVVDFYNESFVAGDSLAVKMTGFLAGQKTQERKYLLAKKTEAKDSLVREWKQFNLDKLEIVDKIEVEVLSNRTDVPKAFCMDNMVANVSISY